jgi:restriction system protein
LEKIIPPLKRKRLDFLEQEHSAAVAKWQDQLDEINLENLRQRRDEEARHAQLVQQFEDEKLQYELAQRQRNEQIDEQRERYCAFEPEALLENWYRLFTDQAYPDIWPEDCHLQYIPGTKTLIVDYELPPIEAFPVTKEVRYIASRKEFKETPIPEAQRKKNYDDILYQLALASLYKLFQSDAADALEMVIFNGWVQSVDKATGAAIHPCILSVQASKEEFVTLNMYQVDPRACFKKLKGVCGSRLVEMTPVQPIMSLNKEDRRFVNACAVADSLGSETNLAAMDWQDFENLIRELFEKEFSQNGGEVKITQASRDGGVDAIAFDPDPIRGGKIVIQAKRYTNCVGVSAVRDLYGTVHNEGATKGILVTTSDFGKDAHDFARGKPLKLLSGSELLYLLQKHGYRARIDLIDAKKQWLAENPRGRALG